MGLPLQNMPAILKSALDVRDRKQRRARWFFFFANRMRQSCVRDGSKVPRTADSPAQRDTPKKSGSSDMASRATAIHSVFF
jgi:hypothetical protein